MKRKWIVLLAVLGSFLTIFTLVIDWMTRYAYDRKSPKLPKFLVNIFMGNHETDPEEKQAIKEEAGKLKESASRKIDMVSYDGKKMAAHYYEADEPVRLVIACHGWRSGWYYDYRTIAPFLHDQHHTSFLFIDLRAHGESEGRYLYYGKKERFDLACWSKYAAEHLTPDLPIYIMGMSAGALSTFMSTTAGLHSQTKGVIVDSCAGSARAIGMSVVNNLKVNPRLLYPFIRLDARIRLRMDDNEYTAFDAAKGNRFPVLFIHGTADKVVNIHSMEKLYDRCRCPKFKLIVEGAGHMKSCFEAPEEYKQALLDFFRFCEKQA